MRVGAPQPPLPPDCDLHFYARGEPVPEEAVKVGTVRARSAKGRWSVIRELRKQACSLGGTGVKNLKVEWTDGRMSEGEQIAGAIFLFPVAVVLSALFQAEPDFGLLGWPFGYDELKPYYDEATELLEITSFQNEPQLQALLDKIATADPNWKPHPLPLGLSHKILSNPEEAKHFDGFASPSGYKSDSERNLIDHIADKPNFTMLVGDPVAERRVRPDRRGREHRLQTGSSPPVRGDGQHLRTRDSPSFRAAGGAAQHRGRRGEGERVDPRGLPNAGAGLSKVRRQC